MFKNNSHFHEACNYSFREELDEDKENDSSLSNYIKKDNNTSMMTKLETI